VTGRNGLPTILALGLLGAATLGAGMCAWADKTRMPTPQNALLGRAARMSVPTKHFVLDAPLEGAFPGMERAMFGMGCFWGAEKMFWSRRGVVSTAVGYAGGFTPNPTYREVCSGETGHTEVVRVIFDPRVVTYEELLRVFWEGHDPTQGMQQGNDVGTQYRSAIFTFSDAQRRTVAASRDAYAAGLRAAGFGAITTEIAAASEFYFAEEYHQQYLGKNPDGYCGHGGTGVSCPIGVQRRAL